MTPDELSVARLSLGMTQAQLAESLGVHRSTVAHWEQGIYPVPNWLPVALRGLGGTS